MTKTIYMINMNTQLYTNDKLLNSEIYYAGFLQYFYEQFLINSTQVDKYCIYTKSVDITYLEYDCKQSLCNNLFVACEEAYNSTEEENTCIFGCKNQVSRLQKFKFDEVDI